MSPGKQKSDPTPTPPLTIFLEGDVTETERRFTDSFRIGRDSTCQIQIVDGAVSRFHVQVFFNDGTWWVQDLDSTNGTFCNGHRVRQMQITGRTRLELGKAGPVVTLMPEEVQPSAKTIAKKASTVTQFYKHYFDESREAGEHTMMVRQAFEYAKKKHVSKYLVAIGIITILLLAVGAFAVYQNGQMQKQKRLAQDIFYSMKTLELELLRLKEMALATSDTANQRKINQDQALLTEMMQSYNKYVKQIDVYSKKLTEEELLILRIARLFGECELAMPPQFVNEVKKYIKKWQSTTRLRRAIQRALDRRYSYPIARAMLENDLPPQFFYLALQESDFDSTTCGRRTRYGIAKGIWQFIPSTARAYGLKIGPLYRYPRPDPRDERLHFEKATNAAARYLRFLYTTEAQASGLLVMASYNWGETNVRKLIHQMPENPQERNFWRLLTNYRNRIPDETYDYVFYIISAAVIGENPKLFGFDFENPLADAEEKLGGLTFH